MVVFFAALSVGKVAALAETRVARQSSVKMLDYPQPRHCAFRLRRNALFFSQSTSPT
jgi:hypothetical protein